MHHRQTPPVPLTTLHPVSALLAILLPYFQQYVQLTFVFKTCWKLRTIRKGHLEDSRKLTWVTDLELETTTETSALSLLILVESWPQPGILSVINIIISYIYKFIYQNSLQTGWALPKWWNCSSCCYWRLFESCAWVGGGSQQSAALYHFEAGLPDYGAGAVSCVQEVQRQPSQDIHIQKARSAGYGRVRQHWKRLLYQEELRRRRHLLGVLHS